MCLIMLQQLGCPAVCIDAMEVFQFDHNIMEGTHFFKWKMNRKFLGLCFVSLIGEQRNRQDGQAVFFVEAIVIDEHSFIEVLLV
ncbi:hypothetical protein ACFSCZ_11515 [Siminovitchia sediminis]|uniref:Uncharacterized protein n=1 Tax=Siminovitchia sediminis TaxID=1274353 RepID=A0ABW4KI30_9BACI